MRLIENERSKFYEVYVGDFEKYEEAKVNADRIQIELGYWTTIKRSENNVN